MQKKTKRDSISTHKEGRLDTFDRVVFLVEMGWCSNSRNAVSRPSPLLTGLTRGRGDLLRSMLHSHSFVLTKQQNIYISRRFFSPLINPSQPARPIDFVRSANSKIWSEVVGTNRLLYRAKLSLGVLVGPALFNQPGVAPLCDMNGHEERTQAAEMQKRRAKIPDPY